MFGFSEARQYETPRKLRQYKLLEPVRAVRDFIGDLLSGICALARRIKSGDEDTRQTHICTKTLAKLLGSLRAFHGGRYLAEAEMNRQLAEM